MAWRNLAPGFHRQRLIIEGITKEVVKPRQIKAYLMGLARVTGMRVVRKPTISSSHKTGYSGWVTWKTSGVQFYSYDKKPPFFTIDTYTCKPFSARKAVEFTKDFLKATKIAWKEIKT